MEQPKYKRTPPNFRRPDNCTTCRAFSEANGCKFYEFKSNRPEEDSVCDDFRPDA